MKVVVDVPSAGFGGIRTYVENLLAAWATRHPEDSLVVVTPAGTDLPLAGHARRDLSVRRPRALTRPLAQTAALSSAVKDVRPDAVLSVTPATSLRRLPVAHAVVVHDLRHELRPDQFTAWQRLVRRVAYSRAYEVADGLISVSRRTQADLIARHPNLSAKTHCVVHHGADHVELWPRGEHRGPAVAFAHHTNKNPDLLIQGWAAGMSRDLAMPDLVIVGAGARRAELEAAVAAAGLADRVRLAPYLSDDGFRRTMAEASIVIMASDFEGFGLPVLEGMQLGARVVIAPEQAMLEVAGGHAAVMTSCTPDALADAVNRAAAFDAAQLTAARAHAAGFTWARCMEETREFLGRLSACA